MPSRPARWWCAGGECCARIGASGPAVAGLFRSCSRLCSAASWCARSRCFASPAPSWGAGASERVAGRCRRRAVAVERLPPLAAAGRRAKRAAGPAVPRGACAELHGTRAAGTAFRPCERSDRRRRARPARGPSTPPAAGHLRPVAEAASASVCTSTTAATTRRSKSRRSASAWAPSCVTLPCATGQPRVALHTAPLSFTAW